MKKITFVNSRVYSTKPRKPESPDESPRGFNREQSPAIRANQEIADSHPPLDKFGRLC
jgi:hypothetical protein